MRGNTHHLASVVFGVQSEETVTTIGGYLHALDRFTAARHAAE
jgi:hypothetical protein